MRLIGKSGILLLLLTLMVAGCKKSILNDDPGITTSDNVRLRIFPYWNNYYFNSDSLYFAGGSFLKVDEISVIHSNFTFVDDGDTLPAGEIREWKITGGTDLLLGYLEPGSYTGFYIYKVGLDSVSNLKPPQSYPEGHPLANTQYYRGPGKGYNFITITGRIQDPNKPNSEPTIPLKWVVATQDLVLDYKMTESFNVVAGKMVTFDVVFDVAKLFDGLFPLVNPIIKADPSDTQDFNLAQTLQNNFKTKAYKIQI